MRRTASSAPSAPPRSISSRPSPDWPAECSSIDWLALGNTEHSVFIPFFSGITDTAPAYHLDGDTYNPDGAF